MRLSLIEQKEVQRQASDYRHYKQHDSYFNSEWTFNLSLCSESERYILIVTMSSFEQSSHYMLYKVMLFTQ